MTWADGRWLGRPAVLGGDIAGATTSVPLGSYVAQYSLGNVPTILSAVLVSRNLLATIDPIADHAVPADLHGPVWYLRVMPERLAPDARGRDVRWIVIDAGTSSVVASHPAVPGP